MSLDARRRTRRHARASAARSAHARRGRRRSVGTATRSRLGARSASPVSALTEPSRRCNARGAVMSLDTRRTRHGGCVCACRRRDRRTHDEVGGTRSARRLARGSALARRASPVSALTEPSRRCNARGAVMSLDTRRTRHGGCVCACRQRDRRTHDEVGGARSARRLARGSALARRASPVSALTEPSRRCNARGAVMSLDTRRTRHGGCVCACRQRDRRTHDEVGGARSARRLARGSALARRASPASALTEPSRRCDARGAVMSLDTRRTRHGGCVCTCRRRDRRTHDEVGGARSARRLARGSALARRASPVSALTEPSRRCNARGAVMSLDTRRTRHGGCVCACRQRDRRTHDEVGGARSARRLARGSALARRASPVSALTEPSRRCNARGAVMSLDTRRTRHGEYVCVCRRRDRRTHDEVGGARSARRLARGPALARRASPASALTEPSRRCDARGAVMSLDTRRTRHGGCVCACRRRDRRTHDEVGGARSARRLARGSALARRASPASALTEPSRRCNARGAVMSLDTRRTRHGGCVCACRQRDRRTHDEVGGARSARRLARGSALARRRRCRL